MRSAAAGACVAMIVAAACGPTKDAKRGTDGSTPATGRRGEPSITGFLQVPFGATREQVVAKLGPPTGVADWDESVALNYPGRTLFDQQAEPTLVVHPRAGLVQGNYLVRLHDFARDCETVFHRLEWSIAARYPRIEPERTRRQDGPGRFCDAVMEGRAWTEAKLADPVNGATVRVAVSPGRPFIDVTYVSAAGQRLVDARSDRELKNNF